jgi:hypothetical protein
MSVKVLKERCWRFEIERVEGHIMAAYVPLCWDIPPKYKIANAIGKLTGKAAILIHPNYARTRNASGFSSGAATFV